MLYTKCIHDPVSLEEGILISIMSRHTLNDGKTPDPKITRDKYLFHFPFLGPSPELIGAYYRKKISWDNFARGYLLEMESEKDFIEEIAMQSRMVNITLECVERKQDFPENDLRCHRKLLADLCKEYVSDLQIIHK